MVVIMPWAPSQMLQKLPRLMSIIYTLLTKRNSIGLEFFVKMWEGDLSQPLKESQWHGILCIIKNASVALQVCLMQHFLLKMYWMLQMLQNIKALSFDVCWCYSKEKEILMHMLWN